MITFKQFLYESRNKHIASDSAIRWMENYSEDYLKAGKWIYRGFDAGDGIMAGSSADARLRKSANTLNYYTLWMDNHPKFEKFPKRSRSFICSTDLHYASGFGAPFLVVPQDTATVGTVGEEDIWAIEIYPDMRLHQWISMTGTVLRELGLNEQDDDWGAFVKTLKSATHQAISKKAVEDDDLKNVLKMMVRRGDAQNLYELWEKCFVPSLFDAVHPADISNSDEGEVWIQDDCIFIPLVQKSLTSEEQAEILEFADDYPKLKKLLFNHWQYGEAADDDVEHIDPDVVSDRDTLTQRRGQR